MFQPKIFSEDNTETLCGLIRENPFATVISTATGQLTADHLPLVLHEDDATLGVLEGHVAAANPLSKARAEPIDILAVFHGPAGYVSPGWYPSKQVTGKAVPTWNYVVVHARGTMRFHRDRRWLLRHLDELTHQHEAHRADPWRVEQTPDDFLARQLKALVGFEIRINHLTGAVKLSQNKSARDRTGVVEGLKTETALTAQALSEAIRTN